MKFGEIKYNDKELPVVIQMRRHLSALAIPLCISLVLSGIILAAGKYLSEFIEVKPDSILFQLWPINSIYLRQFAGSHYTSSEIAWFFTVVSCCNVVWILLFCWQFVLELLRRDITFPPGNTPGLTKYFAIGLAFFGSVFLVSIPVNLAGFYTYRDAFHALSLGQSITTGAMKVVFGRMATFYGFAAAFFTIVVLGARYLIAKRTN